MDAKRKDGYARTLRSTEEEEDELILPERIVINMLPSGAVTQAMLSSYEAKFTRRKEIKGTGFKWPL